MGSPATNKQKDNTRSEFERDFDQIAFSSPFRRMQDKTQVFPLSKNDFTRTRLTHSIEVSCVGRSLGRLLSSHLSKEGFSEAGEVDIGGIVAAACLAHDIGNPPFGHAGEDAIQSWAKSNIEHSRRGQKILFNTAEEVADLHEFEGNAQGLRILTYLYDPSRHGGARLTHATIGAMAKYPCGSLINGAARQKQRIQQKKFGYFQDDKPLICDVFVSLGMHQYELGAFSRHPLAYLVEAADDICYAIIDLEDSVDQGLIDVNDGLAILDQLVSKAYPNQTYGNVESTSKFRWCRALAIRALINSCMEVCKLSLAELRTGHLDKSLVELCSFSQEYKEIKNRVGESAYLNSRVVQVELVGYKVISGLLDMFVGAVLTPHISQPRKYIALMPSAYIGPVNMDLDSKLRALECVDNYKRVLMATDFVSGMTDTFAVDMFQTLSGISLPD